jgi:hypothetical protein
MIGAGAGAKDRSTNRDRADGGLLWGVVVCPSAKPTYPTTLSMLIVMQDLCQNGDAILNIGICSESVTFSPEFINHCVEVK